jgi:pantothenate kinase
MTTFTSIDAVAEFLAAPPSGRRLLGIVGAPGAGKSTIADELAARIPSSVLLPMDGYHYPQAHVVELGRRDRMGAPDTFDVDAFVDMLEAVRFSGEEVLARGFDRTIEEPVADSILISPEKRTIIVEGNYLLCDNGGWERVAPLLDTTFFVTISDEVRHERLIERHVRFGKSPEDARAWALGPDEVNARLITASAPHADHLLELH